MRSSALARLIPGPRARQARNDHGLRRELAAAAEAPTPARGRREATPPEDTALYACGCGCAFEAEVVVDVSCPHCGQEQDW